MDTHRTDFSLQTSASEEVLDITHEIEQRISPEAHMVNAYALHTTCALTAADLDPGTDQDMLDAFREMIPKLSYRHPHDPSHVGDHIMSSLIGPSITLPCENGKIILGTWQRVVLVEFDGPRERQIILTQW